MTWKFYKKIFDDKSYLIYRSKREGILHSMHDWEHGDWIDIDNDYTYSIIVMFLFPLIIAIFLKASTVVSPGITRICTECVYFIIYLLS